MLQLQQRINEAEKNTEKQLHDAQVEKEIEVSKIKKLGNDKLQQGDVKINELKEENLSKEEIFKKMSIYEI